MNDIIKNTAKKYIMIGAVFCVQVFIIGYLAWSDYILKMTKEFIFLDNEGLWKHSPFVFRKRYISFNEEY